MKDSNRSRSFGFQVQRGTEARGPEATGMANRSQSFARSVGRDGQNETALPYAPGRFLQLCLVENLTWVRCGLLDALVVTSAMLCALIRSQRQAFDDNHLLSCVHS
jgi:hypothetical protein